MKTVWTSAGPEVDTHFHPLPLFEVEIMVLERIVTGTVTCYRETFVQETLPISHGRECDVVFSEGPPLPD